MRRAYGFASKEAVSRVIKGVRDVERLRTIDPSAAVPFTGQGAGGSNEVTVKVTSLTAVDGWYPGVFVYRDLDSSSEASDWLEHDDDPECYIQCLNREVPLLNKVHKGYVADIFLLFVDDTESEFSDEDYNGSPAVIINPINDVKPSPYRVDAVHRENVDLSIQAPNIYDEVSLDAPGKKILLVGQTTASENGVYEMVGEAGSGVFMLERPDDLPVLESGRGIIVHVVDGVYYSNTLWQGFGYDGYISYAWRMIPVWTSETPVPYDTAGKNHDLVKTRQRWTFVGGIDPVIEGVVPELMSGGITGGARLHDTGYLDVMPRVRVFQYEMQKDAYAEPLVLPTEEQNYIYLLPDSVNPTLTFNYHNGLPGAAGDNYYISLYASAAGLNASVPSTGTKLFYLRNGANTACYGIERGGFASVGTDATDAIGNVFEGGICTSAAGTITGYAATGSSNTFTEDNTIHPSTNEVPLTLQGSSGQTANLQNYTNHSGTVLGFVASTAAMTMPSFTSTGAGGFTGIGTGLTALNASELTSGTVPDAAIGNVDGGPW